MRAWKTVHVFISSTFRDMHAERDYLVRFVFPELRERCAKRFLHLIDVDLRWGVTKAEAEQRKAVEICLDEVERCRPFFIGLLGERYGRILTRDDLPDRPDYGWLTELAESHSLTALEIYHAVLRDPQLKTRSFFYFRDPSFLKDIPKENQAEFFSDDEGAAEKLRTLKIKIKETSPVYENYPCIYNGVDENGTVNLTGLEEFGKHVLDDLWSAINKEHPEDKAELDELASERTYHEAFRESSTQNFVGRRDVLDALKAFADSEDEDSIALTGIAGCGKSAALAAFAKEYSEQHAETFVLTHFIGVSPGSTDARRTLLRLCRELQRKFGLQREFTTDYYELRLAFVQLLGSAAARGKVLLVIDGLDQLDHNHDAQNLGWLPRGLPKGLKLIVSSREGDYLDALRRRNPVPAEMALRVLAENERQEIVRHTLNAYGKTLDEVQMRLLLEKKESDNPFYLIVACEEMRVYGDFKRLSDKLESLANGVDSLLIQVLERMEHDHGRELVKDAFSLLECSRYGLFESEMLELLARQGETQLPQAIWSRLYRSIQFYLRPPGENSESRLNFFHVKFAEAVRAKYLQDEETQIALHKRLAYYFQRKADPGNNRSWAGNYPHAISELTHHQLSGKLYDDLFTVAREETFLRTQVETFSDDLELQLQTLQNAIIGASQIDDAAKMVEFLFRHCHQVRIFGAEFPFRIFQETGNLARAVNLCEIWFHKSTELGSLQFLWLAWELNKHGRSEDANDLLCSLARRESQLPMLKDEWQGLAAVALSQISDLDHECFSKAQARLLNNEGKLSLCTNLILDESAITGGCEKSKIKSALTVANEISLPAQKAEAYIVIAQTQAKAGDDVTETFELAKKAVHQIGNDDWEDMVLRSIAQAQAHVGKNEDALKTAANINTSHDKEFAYLSIAKALAQLGEYGNALNCVEKMSEPFLKNRTYFFIANSQAQAGKYEDALRTLIRFDVRYQNDEIYDLVVQSQLAATNFDKALETIEKIAAPETKTNVYVSMALAQIRAGTDATETLALALKSAEQIKDAFRKVKAYSSIADARARTGNDITGILESALKTVDDVESLDKRDAYKLIACLQAQAGKYTDVLKTIERMENRYDRTEIYQSVFENRVGEDPAGVFDLALDLFSRPAEKINITFQRANSFAAIGSVQSQAGRDATRAFDLALETIEKLGDPKKKARACTLVAAVQAQAGADTTKTFDLAFKTAGEIKDWEEKATAYASIGFAKGASKSDPQPAFELALQSAAKLDGRYQQEAYELIAEKQVAAGTYRAALKTVEKLRRSEKKPRLCISIAQGLAWTGEYGEALKTALMISNQGLRATAYIKIVEALSSAGKYDDALQIVERIKDPEKKSDAYNSIVQLRLKAGMYDEALETISKIDDPYWQAESYGMVALAHAQEGKDERALELVAKIDGDFWQADGYKSIALAQIKGGRDATGTFALALSAAGRIDDPEIRVDAYRSIAEAQARVGKDTTAAFDLAWKTVDEIDDKDLKAEIHNLVVEMQTGKDSLAESFFSGVTDILQQQNNQLQFLRNAKEHIAFARSQVMAGNFDGAMRTTESILVNRDHALPQVAWALALKGNKPYLKKLLLPSSYYLNACYEISGILSLLYPKQVDALLETLNREA